MMSQPTLISLTLPVCSITATPLTRRCCHRAAMVQDRMRPVAGDDGASPTTATLTALTLPSAMGTQNGCGWKSSCRITVGGTDAIPIQPHSTPLAFKLQSLAHPVREVIALTTQRGGGARGTVRSRSQRRPTIRGRGGLL